MKKVRIRLSDVTRTEREVGRVVRAYLTRMIARAKFLTLQKKGGGQIITPAEAIQFPSKEQVARRWNRVKGSLKVKNPEAWTPNIIPDFVYYKDRLVDREEEAKLVEVLFGMKRKAYITAVLKAAQDLGGQPFVSEDVLQALRNKVVKIVTTEITPTLRDELVARLERNITAGFTIDETAHSLGLLNTNWRTIAKTETHDVYEMGSFNQVKREADEVGGQAFKYWQHSGNPDGRPEHLAAADFYDEAHAIPIDEPFIVGGESLMHPHDPNGSAANIINCGCTAIYLIK